jgi:hypothetical protein
MNDGKRSYLQGRRDQGFPARVVREVNREIHDQLRVVADIKMSI